MSTPGIVIRRLTPSSPNAERARSRSMTLRSSPSRSNSRRCRSTARRSSSGRTWWCSRPSARPAQIGVRAGEDQMAVQDRLDDVLQARSLPDDLVAPGHLPATRLRRLIWNPDFRRKNRSRKAGRGLSRRCIGLDLRRSDDAHLHGVRDHDFPKFRAATTRRASHGTGRNGLSGGSRRR